MSLRRFSGVRGGILTGLVLTVIAAGVWNFRRSSTQDSAAVLDRGFFPAGLSATLQERLADAANRVRNAPVAASWGTLGELCMAHELMPQAMICFRQAAFCSAKAGRENPKWIYLQAVIAEEVDLNEAVSLYHRVGLLDASKAFVNYRLGRLLARIGDFSEAETTLKLAEQQSKSHPATLLARAQLRAMQNDLPGAEELIERAAADESCGLDLIAEAKRILQRIPEAELSASLTKTHGRPPVTEPLSEPWLAGVVRKMPQTASVAAQAGAQATRQNFEVAIELYDRLLQIDARNSRAHSFRSMVLMNSGNTEQALKEIQKVCVEFPKDAMAWSCRGAIEARSGAIDAAILSLKEAVRLKPDFADAQMALLLMYREKNDAKRMEQQYHRLLELSPADQQLRDRYDTFQKDRGMLK